MYAIIVLILPVLFLVDNSTCKRPNVLLLIIDDLKPAIRCYEDKSAYTPNIDFISKKSFLFKNAFAQVIFFSVIYY